MQFKKTVRKKLSESQKGRILMNRVRILREKKALKDLSDEEYVKKMYLERFGEPLDLSDPVTLGAKLQWLKMFYRDPVIPRCTDKYELHGYLNELGYGWLCNEVIGIYEDARDIDFDMLPDRFVAKATHGSGWNIICKNKGNLNWSSTIREMNSWLKLNLFVFGREWNYRDIKPRILIERYIDHEPLNDYKYMCFNGKALYMQLNNDFEGTHYVDFYDLENWEHLPITYDTFQRSDRVIEKPEQFSRMKELAEELSKPFPFVRVDFYNFDSTVILGEMTFFPSGGLWRLRPSEYGYNEILGEKLVLPEPNHNLELLQKICSGEKNDA